MGSSTLEVSGESTLVGESGLAEDWLMLGPGMEVQDEWERVGLDRVEKRRREAVAGDRS